jgi:hypothetical protein
MTDARDQRCRWRAMSRSRSGLSAGRSVSVPVAVVEVADVRVDVVERVVMMRV